MNNAFEELLAFQRALKDLVASVDATYSKQYDEFSIGLEGSFGNKHVTPRTLTSRLLGSMVCVEGIITKCEFYYVWFPLFDPFAHCFSLSHPTLLFKFSMMKLYDLLSLCFRFSGASQSGAQRPLLPHHQEDDGKEVHRFDFLGRFPFQCHLPH